MLVKEILKHTPNDVSEHHEYEKALHSFEMTAKYIND
jgi:hypothetical protein